MTSNTLVRSSSIEQGYISRDRIVDGDSIPDELFCPICRFLLWKPHSCASCQYLFCEKCIQRWIDDPISGKSCPFRCQRFKDHRCPPSIQSMLSRINIHCRNSEFGCSQILRYDQLENRENVQCDQKRTNQLIEEQNCGRFDHLLIMLKFILLNWSKIPYFLCAFTTGGFMSFGVIIFGLYMIFSYWTYQHFDYGYFMIVLSSYLLCYGTSIICQFIPDSTIIICLCLFMFVSVCMSKVAPLEMTETEYLFDRPILSIVFYSILILIMKIMLLLIRFYFWSMSVYTGATLFTFFNFCMAFKTDRIYANIIAIGNQ